MVQFKKRHIVGIIIAVIILMYDFFFMYGERWFVPLIIISITIGWIQFWIDFFYFSYQRKEYEANFLDFVRNLVGAVKSGMPVSKAIIHVSRNSEYGSLHKLITKLSNQIEWAIPVRKALKTFANSTNNNIIKRAITTVIEAEEAGGNLEDVLESITLSLIEIKKIKDARKASIHGQIMQSYIIFFVFLGVMVVIQNVLVPYMTKMQGNDVAGVGNAAAKTLVISSAIDMSSIVSFISSVFAWFTTLHGIFLMLGLLQGLFAGLVIGKLSEGDLTVGVKHSVILMTIAFFIMSLAQG